MNLKKSIVILTAVSVFIILMAVFAVVSFPIGNTVYDYHGYATTIKLGLDLSGGVSAVFEVVDDGKGDIESRVDGTITSLQDLLVSRGYTEATVTKTTSGGGYFIRVEVPDVDEPDKVFDLIGRPARLEFKGENDASAETLLNGSEHLESAFVTTQDGQYAVGLNFNEEGTKVFADITEQYNGSSIYIFIDGSLYTTVNVQSVITNGSAVITRTGGYAYEEAREFATRLQSGAFGVELNATEVKTISPTLGEDAIKWALVAGAIGVGLIFIFMGVTYRGLGIAADIALCVYIVLLLWFCAVLPWVQLTLSGIAGILLSIGMAVDGNIVIFERIRDEYRGSSKPIPTAIKVGFKRSAAAIIDGNVTTLIGAVVLWVLGSSTLVGFAVTLFIGIVLSMFTSLVITRLVLKCFMPLNSTGEKFYGLKRGEPKPAPDFILKRNAAAKTAKPVANTAKPTVNTPDPQPKQSGFDNFQLYELCYLLGVLIIFSTNGQQQKLEVYERLPWAILLLAVGILQRLLSRKQKRRMSAVLCAVLAGISLDCYSKYQNLYLPGLDVQNYFLYCSIASGVAATLGVWDFYHLKKNRKGGRTYGNN